MPRLAAWIAVLTCLMPAAAGGADVVSPRAFTRAKTDGRARVIVAIRTPATAPHAPSREARRAATGSARRAVLQTVAPDALSVTREYNMVPGFAAHASTQGLAQLAQHPDVLRVDLDGEGGGGLAVSVPQIRADRARARGITGAGAVIAVLDTGVDAAHPDLHDGLIHEECFCSATCCPNGSARQSGPGSAASRSAHGVHVAGIALSRGRVSSVGVAPAARLVALRVLDDNNRGLLSDWIAGLDWLASEGPSLGVRIVNMSLVSDELYSGTCDQAGAANLLFADLIEQLYAFPRSTLVFAAAGNNYRANSMTAPACIARAVAVGAVDAKDQVAAFSNGGAALDLLAPGVNVISDASGGDLATMSGTSMAAPHAAGTAALLLSALPAATAQAIETALRSTGVPVVDHRNGLTVPRVEALAALNAIDTGNPLVRGGGSRASDCLLEWNFLPPDIVRDGPLPVATCPDNDPVCDADTIDGQCTFRIRLCFNTIDPRMPACPVAEPISWYTLSSPRTDAPPGDAERQNAANLTGAIPAVPITGPVCGEAFPFVVPRPADGDRRGFDEIRLAVLTETRSDYDRVRLICAPPRP